MRVELTKLLIQKPKVVLLDEPTNHLDIESIQWLERYLVQYPGIILISHDKTFRYGIIIELLNWLTERRMITNAIILSILY